MRNSATGSAGFLSEAIFCSSQCALENQTHFAGPLEVLETVHRLERALYLMHFVFVDGPLSVSESTRTRLCVREDQRVQMDGESQRGHFFAK